MSGRAKQRSVISSKPAPSQPTGANAPGVISKTTLSGTKGAQLEGVFFSREFFDTNIEKMMSEALELLTIIGNKEVALDGILFAELKWGVNADKSKKHLVDIQYKKKIDGSNEEKATQMTDSIFVGIEWILSFVIWINFLSQHGEFPNGVKLTDDGKKFAQVLFGELQRDQVFIQDYGFLLNTFLKKDADAFFNIERSKIPLYVYFFNLLQLSKDTDVNEWFPFQNTPPGEKSFEEPFFEYLLRTIPETKKNQFTFEKRKSSSMYHCFEFIQRSTRFFEKIKITLVKLLSLSPFYYIYIMSGVGVTPTRIQLLAYDVLKKTQEPAKERYFIFTESSLYLNRMKNSKKLDIFYDNNISLGASFDSSFDFPQLSSSSAFFPKIKQEPLSDDLFLPEPGPFFGFADTSSSPTPKPLRCVDKFRDFVNVFQNNIAFVSNTKNVEAAVSFFMKEFVLWKFGDKRLETDIDSDVGILSNKILINLELIKKSDLLNIGGVPQLLQVSKLLGTRRNINEPYWNDPGSQYWIFGKLTRENGDSDNRFVPCVLFTTENLANFNVLILLRRLLIAYIYLKHGGIDTSSSKESRPFAYNFLTNREAQKKLPRSFIIDNLLEPLPPPRPSSSSSSSSPSSSSRPSSSSSSSSPSFSFNSYE